MNGSTDRIVCPSGIVEITDTAAVLRSPQGAATVTRKQIQAVVRGCAETDPVAGRRACVVPLHDSTRVLSVLFCDEVRDGRFSPWGLLRVIADGQPPVTVQLDAFAWTELCAATA